MERAPDWACKQNQTKERHRVCSVSTYNTFVNSVYGGIMIPFVYSSQDIQRHNYIRVSLMYFSTPINHVIAVHEGKSGWGGVVCMHSLSLWHSFPYRLTKRHAEIRTQGASKFNCICIENRHWLKNTWSATSCSQGDGLFHWRISMAQCKTAVSLVC